MRRRRKGRKPAPCADCEEPSKLELLKKRYCYDCCKVRRDQILNQPC